jgi:hypothetical protein
VHLTPNLLLRKTPEEIFSCLILPIATPPCLLVTGTPLLDQLLQRFFV